MLDSAAAAVAEKVFGVGDHPGGIAVAAVAENIVEIGLGQAKVPTL